ncbi:HAD superfamily, subfamily IIIB acid phosphatase [Actinidia rufa]|uniref:HAD superfamily, subfamily IIIB acid phosphatase n=1 Tax=Actinidia rufa TaxID=165716 RepID=A0A7J0E7N9_9ERIC|nr:HAD superfamily, subfamily IIIB acid phosphatase [Actinidia rufa]
MRQRIWEALVFLLLAMLLKPVSTRPHWRPSEAHDSAASYCLSWRLAVEANDIYAWRTVPTQCLKHVENYMTGGQYERDLNFIMEHIIDYIDTIEVSDDGLDAWILDVDDTCISNLIYYRRKRFGCDPYDPDGFKRWALRGGCPAIPAVLRLFNKLVGRGFKVFLVTGRDEATLGQATLDNLQNQGFIGYQSLILRSMAYKGQSAVKYKSEIRSQLEEGEGYRIWGNVGDQWSDLQGNCTGNRAFKLPNPMYFVP